MEDLKTPKKKFEKVDIFRHVQGQASGQKLTKIT
jgi:hypothetical protein